MYRFSQNKEQLADKQQTKVNRKNSGYLPVPCHIRASSTPVNTDTSRKDLISNHRRFPSCIDSTMCMDMKKDIRKNTVTPNNPKERSPKKSTILDNNSDQISKQLFNPKSDEIPQIVRNSMDGKDQLDRVVDNSGHIMPRKPIQASPELLAALLKGSSEKLTAEQHQMSRKSGISLALPPAVLTCLVS